MQLDGLHDYEQTAQLAYHWLEWTADVRAHFGVPTVYDLLDVPQPQLRPAEMGVRFCRGFVCEVRLPLALWLEHGKEALRLFPIEKVAASDREPVAVNDLFGWYDQDKHILLPDEPTGALPSAVWECLPGGRVADLSGRCYRTRESAVAALSRAMMIVLRDRAPTPV